MAVLDMPQNSQILRTLCFWRGTMTSQVLAAFETLSYSRQTGWLRAGFTTNLVEVSPVTPQTKNGLYRILKKCCTITHCCRNYMGKSIRLPRLSLTGRLQSRRLTM